MKSSSNISTYGRLVEFFCTISYASLGVHNCPVINGTPRLLMIPQSYSKAWTFFPTHLLRINIPSRAVAQIVSTSPTHSPSVLASILRHGILHHLWHTSYAPLLSHHVAPQAAKTHRWVTEFTSQLEGYEGVTAQCHNCEYSFR